MDQNCSVCRAVTTAEAVVSSGTAPVGARAQGSEAMVRAGGDLFSRCCDRPVALFFSPALPFPADGLFSGCGCLACFF